VLQTLFRPNVPATRQNVRRRAPQASTSIRRPMAALHARQDTSMYSWQQGAGAGFAFI